MTEFSEKSRGHGNSISRKQEAAIAALLISRTQTDAALKAGVSVSTLRRWVKDEVFAAGYQAAKRDLLEGTINQIRSVSSVAVRTLAEIASDKRAKSSARVAACRTILSVLLDGVEAQSLSDRLDAWEAAENG